MIEEVFQTWAKEIYNKNVVQAFLAEVIDIRNASCELLVDYMSNELAMYVRHPTKILYVRYSSRN